MGNRAEIAKNVVFWVSAVVVAGAVGYAFYYDGGGGSSAAPPPVTAPGTDPAAAPAAGNDATHPVPFEAFAGAQVGDWRAYRHTSDSTLGGFSSTAVMWVKEAGADEVVVGVHGRLEDTGEERGGRDERFPRAGLTLERLEGHDIGDWTVLETAVTDDTRTVGGREFACKKITYTSRDPMFPSKRTTTELWLSPDVPVGGVVAKREVQVLGDQRFVLTDELIGYGTATETTWGTKPALSGGP